MSAAPPPPYPLEKPMMFKSAGTMARVSRNRVSCSFVIDGYQMMFDATLNPAMPPFTSKSAAISYQDADHLTGTYQFNGAIGPTAYEIKIVKNGITIAVIEGELNEPSLPDKHQVHGSGSWMST